MKHAQFTVSICTELIILSVKVILHLIKILEFNIARLQHSTSDTYFTAFVVLLVYNECGKQAILILYLLIVII